MTDTTFLWKSMMQNSNESLSEELVAMAEHDLSLLKTLAPDGSLGSHGYHHPSVEAVHSSNAERLEAIIAQYGWPGKSLVGEEGAWAAWLIAQHAIADPPFMRHCLSLLKLAASNNDVTPWQVAMLEDRICMYEGRPQIYGTQFQPNRTGEWAPYMIENPDGVNERRLAVGLNTLEERTAEIKDENVVIPPDHNKQYEKWLCSVGWKVAADGQ